MKPSPLRSRRLKPGLCLLGTLSLTGLTAQAQLQTAGNLLVNLEFNTLTPGDLPYAANAGTLGGGFESSGSAANIPKIRPNIGGTGVTGLALGGEQFLVSVQGQTPLGGVQNRLDAPEGLVGTQPVRSVEAWVYNPYISEEETVLAWGRRNTGDGRNFSALYGSNPTWGALGQWGAPDLGWANAEYPATGQWHHLAWVHSGPGDSEHPENTTCVYVDGQLNNQEDAGPLNTNTSPIAIGAQWEPDGTTLTPGLRGSMYLGRVRVHSGVMTDAQVLANYNAERAAFPNSDTPAALAQGPIHRWSFSETAGPTVGDSAGNLHGQIKGSGATLNGQEVTLPGPDAGAAYVDLPNHLISNRASALGGSGEVTLEIWATATAVRPWSRFIDFGSTAGGELQGPGGGGEGLDYLIVTAQFGVDPNITPENRSRATLRNHDPLGRGETGQGGPDVQIDADYDHNAHGQQRHVTLVWREGEPVLVYEGDTLVQEVRTGGIRMENLNDVNCWLGRSNWTGDSALEGSINEFRVYDRALTPQEIAKNDTDGPGVTLPPPPDADADGLPDWFERLHSAVLNPATPNQSGLDGDNDGLTNLQEFQRGLNPALDDTDGDGLKDGAEITAGTDPLNPDTDGDGLTDGEEVNTHGSDPTKVDTDGDGYTDSQEVAGGSNPADAASFPGLFLVNRYSFNTAAGEAADGAQVIDSVSGQHATVRGEGAQWTGTEITLPGDSGSDSSAYVDLPNGIISRFGKASGGRGAVTVEAWMTVSSPAPGNWPRIFDFGSTWPGQSLGEIFRPGRVLTGGTGARDFIAVTGGRNTDLNVRRLEWRNADPAGGASGDFLVLDWDTAETSVDVSHHVVLVMDESSGQVQLYENGTLATSGATPLKLSSLNDVNNWLGRSNFTTDANLFGSYDEFRIYDGAMPAADVVKSRDKGPDALAEGGNAATDITTLQVLNASGWPQWWVARNANLPAADSDADGDGLTALQELGRGSDPTKADTDGDGLSDAVETNTGTFVSAANTGTNPAVADTDRDGLNDGQEIAAGSDPFDQDTDGDFAFDGADARPLDPDAANTPAIAHHWTFNGGTEGALDAGTTFPDIAGGATFPATVLGNGATLENGEVVLPGGPNNNDTAYINLPNQLIQPQSKVTIVTWFTVLGNTNGANGDGNWSRVFDFGNSGGVNQVEVPPGAVSDSTNYLFYSAQRGTDQGLQRVAIRTAADGDSGIDFGTATTQEEQIFVVVTVDSSAGDSSVINVFRDGEWQTVNGGAYNTLSDVNDVNNWLGRSQFGGDSTLNGSFNEFRIYNGILNQAAIEALYEAGPVTGNAGPVEDLRVTGVTLNGASVQLTFSSTAGTKYLVEASDNLTNWTTVVETFTANGTSTQTTAPAGGPGKRFFRVRLVP